MPYLLPATIDQNHIYMYWEMPRGFIQLNGLEHVFTVELSCPERHDRKCIAPFHLVYHGEAMKFHLDNLKPNTTYVLRLRAENPLFPSAWTCALRVKTCPAKDQSYFIAHCQTLEQVMVYVSEEVHQHNEVIQIAGVQWLIRHFFANRDRAKRWILENSNSGLEHLKHLFKTFQHHEYLMRESLYVLHLVASVEDEALSVALAQPELLHLIMDIRKRLYLSPEIVQWLLGTMGFLARDNGLSGCRCFRIFRYSAYIQLIFTY